MIQRVVARSKILEEQIRNLETNLVKIFLNLDILHDISNYSQKLRERGFGVVGTAVLCKTEK